MNVLDYLTCPMAIDIEAAHQQWHALGPMAVPVPLQLAQVAFPLMGGNTQLVPLKALCFFNCDPVDYLDLWCFGCILMYLARTRTRIS